MLPAPLAAALRELGGRCGATATLASILLAAWAAVLARTSGEEDVLFGTPVESRRPEAEGLIGPFRNVLVRRARPRLDRGYGPLVDEVRQAAAGAGAHQDLPLEMLLTALDLPRDPRRAPPFQVLFLLRSQPAPRLSFAGLRVAVSAPDPAADLAGEVFELGLIVEERSDPRGEGDGDGGIGLRLAYDALLFTEATAARLLDHLAAFLAAALAAPERPLAELPLLSTSERRQLLAWSDGGEAGEDGAWPPLAHHAFLAQAARTPGAPAIVAEGREVSYGELAHLARSLARRLVALGIGPESRVAIALEGSPRRVAAVLAVLAAGEPTCRSTRRARSSAWPSSSGTSGGTPVGTSGAAPSPRRSSPAAGTRRRARRPGSPACPACTSLTSTRSGRPSRPSRRRRASRRADPASEPTPGPSREGLAYIIYTSGSTGAPKGVMIRHGGLASYVLATRRDLALTPADRMLQFASLSFDASAEEIFCCLASGAALILRNDAMLAGAPAFLGACASWGVTVCDLPTVFWQELVDRVDAGEAAWPPSLRLFVTGGERALPERVARLRRQLAPAVRVINSYGPTEVTVAATSHTLHGEPDGPPRPLRELPIGRPLLGARAYVLNGARELCPPGIPRRARDRRREPRPRLPRAPGPHRPRLPSRPLRRPLRRADVHHRRSGAASSGWRGGGRARVPRPHRPPGQGAQGVRIELAEIEGALAQHPAVAEAACVGVDERRAGERERAGRLGGRRGRGRERHGGRAPRVFLKERLPEPMVPPSPLRPAPLALPRNASGALDRRALPVPKLDATSAGGYERSAGDAGRGRRSRTSLARHPGRPARPRAVAGTTSSPSAAARAPPPACPPSPGAGARRPAVARQPPRADDLAAALASSWPPRSSSWTSSGPSSRRPAEGDTHPGAAASSSREGAPRPGQRRGAPWPPRRLLLDELERELAAWVSLREPPQARAPARPELLGYRLAPAEGIPVGLSSSFDLSLEVRRDRSGECFGLGETLVQALGEGGDAGFMEDARVVAGDPGEVHAASREVSPLVSGSSGSPGLGVSGVAGAPGSRPGRSPSRSPGGGKDDAAAGAWLRSSAVTPFLARLSWYCP